MIVSYIVDLAYVVPSFIPTCTSLIGRTDFLCFELLTMFLASGADSLPSLLIERSERNISWFLPDLFDVAQQLVSFLIPN